MSVEPTPLRNPTASEAGVLDQLIGDVAHLVTAVAGRIARRLPLLALLAAVAGIVVWATLGAALLDEGGSWRWVSLALAAACVVPVVLVLINWRRLRQLSRREAELSDEMRGLVGSLHDQAAAFSNLERVKNELAERKLGVRGLVDIGQAIRKWRGARDDTSERSTALIDAFGLAGWTGVGVCAIALIAVVVAVPIAIIAGSAVWAT